MLALLLGSSLAAQQPPSTAAERVIEQVIERVQAERVSDPAEALALLDETIENPPLEIGTELARLYQLRAEIRRGMGDYDSAMADARRFLDLLGDDTTPIDQARGLFLKGTIAAERNEFATALAHFHGARQILEGSQHDDERARIYNAIGVTHNFNLEQVRARPYYERALDLARRGDNLTLQATILSNLASTVAVMEDTEEAIRLYQTAMTIGQDIGDQALIALSLANICDLQVQVGRHDDALENCPRALELVRPSGQIRLIAGLNMTIGDLYRDIGQPEQALAHYQESLAFAEHQVGHVERQVLERLADLHESRGELEVGLGYLRRLLRLRDDLESRERLDLVEELETRFKVQEQQRALEVLTLQSELQASQLRQRNVWLWAMGSGLALVTCLVLVILRGVQRQASLEQTLNERNQALEEAVEEVGRLAAHDTLTGLLNRRAFTAAAEREISKSRHSGQALAVALGDIDRFKQLNDTHGHPVGDEVLKQIAKRLSASLREHDRICRWGGEEFLCLLVGVDQQQAEQTIDRIRQAVAASPVQTYAGPITVRMTFGVAAMGLSLDHSVLAADRAMYRGKQAGRDRVVMATMEDLRRHPDLN